MRPPPGRPLPGMQPSIRLTDRLNSANKFPFIFVKIPAAPHLPGRTASNPRATAPPEEHFKEK